MKTYKTLGIATTVWAALACSVALSLHADPDGDIWSIRRAAGGDHGADTLSMSDNPVTAEQTVKFKFRLLNRDPEANTIAHGGAEASATTWNNMWRLLAKDPSSGKVATNVIDMVNATNFPAKVGVWVSGRCQWADIESVDLVPDNWDYTDIICSYTAQPGDFGLLTLAAGTEAKPVEAAAEGTGASSYLLKNSRYWGFFDSLTKTNACHLWMTGKGESEVSAWVTFPSDDTPRWVSDRDLSKAGIYIRTINFDDYKFDDGIWRRIAAGGTSSYVSEGKVKRSPMLSIPGSVATDHSVTLYAWTEDDSVAYMKDGDAYDFGGVTRKVTRIPLSPDDGESVEIPGGIYALPGATNKTTKIFLSATPTNIFRAGVLVTNFVTRTILVGPPEPPSLKVLLNAASEYTAPAGASNQVIEVSVSLDGVGSEMYTNAMDVTISAAMVDASSTNSPYTFIGISNTPGGDPDGTSATVHFEPKSIETFDSVYVFVKRASDETAASTKGIRLVATVDDVAKDFFSGGITPGTLHVTKSNPVVTAPATDTVYNDVPAGEPFEMTFNVADAYGELSGSYTLEYTLTGIWSAMNTKTLDLGVPSGSDKALAANIIFNTSVSNALFRVRNQDGYVSDAIRLTVNVFSRPMISATPYDHPPGTNTQSRVYGEGEIAKLQISLGKEFSLAEAGYVFLVPQNEVSSNLVKTTAFTEGIRIVRGQTTSDRLAQLTLLDGSSAGVELRYAFELWDTSDKSGARIGMGTDGYASGEIALYVTNVMPRVKGVSMSDTPIFTSGGTNTASAARDVTKIFKIESVDEPSDIDLDAADPDQFMTEWKFYERGAVLFSTNVYGNPYTAAIPYAFHNSGINMVTVKVRDKDMSDQDFKKSEAFTFYVETLDEPTISMLPHNGTSFDWSEDNYGSINGRVDVKLNIAPTETIVVQIDVERAGTSDGLTRDPVLNTNLLTFTTGTTSRYFYFTELDGGASYFLKARVITTTQSVDPTKTWAEFYHLEEDGGYPMTVDNISPVIQGIADTNAIPASIDVRGYTIKWEAKDVMPDVREGMTASWTVEGATEDVPITSTNTTGIGLGTVGGTYSPLFTSAGPKTVTLTVTDKNGGVAVRYYYFNVEPSKDLYLYPQGPMKRGVSFFSSYYISAAGLGAGRVWIDNLDPKISGFEQKWTLAPALDTINVYGYGYRVGESATGSLTPGRDFCLDVNGNLQTNSTGVALYEYPDELYDSFFYCWILDTPDESGNFVGAHLGAIQPAVGTDATDLARQPVVLPDYDTDTVQYERRYVEGIFAREFLQTDNVGDINQDGIPDIYAASVAWSGEAAKEGFGGSSETAGSRLFEIAGYTSESAGDLKSLRNFNGDNDYLPSKTSEGGTLIPGIKSDWATYGDPFNAYLELRGWGDGLNYRQDNLTGRGRNTTGKWISEKDFSELEMIAYSNAWVAAGSPGNLEDFDWSPENRTDPTIADTDGDGLPDGYEYYLWYRAFVGYFEYDTVGRTNIYRRLAGSRFRLEDIGEGTLITPDEIAEAFNPNKYASDLSLRDTDNDGLMDLEEFALGTNPIHWDTDGDGISDYWEVIRGLNPLYAESELIDSESNPDGDFMAKRVVGSNWGVITFAEDTKTGIAPILALKNNGASVIDSATLKVKEGVTNVEAILVFRYGDSTKPVVPRNRGIWKATVPSSGYTRYECLKDGSRPLDTQMFDITKLGEVRSVTTDQTLMLIHDQVRAQYGFDPRTGWYKLAGVDLVNARWDLSWLGRDVGTAVNTEPYRNLDEYLLLKYRYMTTGSIDGKDPVAPAATTCRVDPITRNLTYDKARLVKWRSALVTPGVLADQLPDQLTLADIFLEATTNPNLRYSQKTYGDYRAPKTEGSSEGSGESEEEGTLVEFSSRVHGADTDCDGVPDGWELYVGYDPNDFYNGYNERDNYKQDKDNVVFLDHDGDRLSLVEEYAGTDSCNAYSNCVSHIDRTNLELDDSDNLKFVATIYENHPGNKKRWFNKFWPTDPWDQDTDGDHIDDKLEGDTGWTAPFAYNRQKGTDGVSYHHTFIYKVNDDEKTEASGDGDWADLIKTVVYPDYDDNNKIKPVDDGYVCIRGGGLNPCTVDTDFDLLPDAWEFEFAGVLFTPKGVPEDMPPDVFGTDSVVLMRRSDGLETSTNELSLAGYYISGGMDGTFGWKVGTTYTGDAFTSNEFEDERTRTKRDYDFDHDGLQNFQEYLVQALRHLRYDDSETPLMGRCLSAGASVSGSFVGFLPMNVMDGDTFYKEALKAGFSGSGAWNFADLGYFAPPPRKWDAAALRANGGSDYDEVGYRFMLPPHGLAGSDSRLLNPCIRGIYKFYATTDPRRWDSDDDGMDDYYELFHGLNPLLGSIMDPGTADEAPAGDVIAQIYWSGTDLDKINGRYISFWNNAWRDWPGESGAAEVAWLGTGVYKLFDPFRYPWMMGAAEADADGDGIRNAEEALIPNMANPQPTHTDPTPLWFTDSTALNKASYTSQYYLRPKDLKQYRPWVFNFSSKQTSDGANEDFLFSFEENEGYDTDNDWISDSEEQRMTSTPISDPLRFTDPDRRQAIWFPGGQSAAVSRSEKFQTLNYASYDFLRQFTVEAWIRPDNVERKQVILERACWYGASTLSNNLAQIRANFLLGILEDGRLYGLYDSSDALPSESDSGSAKVVGLKLAANEWTHIALSYDGKQLKLYMNGTVVASEGTTLIPANGIVTLLPEAYPGMLTFPIIENGYDSVPSAMVLGAKVVSVNGIGVSSNSTWEAYTDYYSGYLDEVRIWDGARLMDGILGSMRKRLSFDDISALRGDVYAAWAAGGTRNDNDGRPNLPAELVAHYNFQTLPGATEPNYVAWEPSGFTKNVRDNTRVDEGFVPGDIYCGWWYSAAVHSTVYKNWRLVPWIQNTAAHLPPMDGSAVDSRYWSAFFGGLTSSNEVDVAKIQFPNTANPYPYYFYTTERYYHKDRLERMAEMDLVGSHLALTNYLFELRSTFAEFSDLVPLGGAFAKRCDDMWDENGPMGAWEYTLYDNNANGIPDWWEKFARNYSTNGLSATSWDQEVYWYESTNYFGNATPAADAYAANDGVFMAAREAYLRDLQRGMIPPSGEIPPADDGDGYKFKNMSDSDNDGLPDWWEDLYGIKSQNGLDDADNDGLSNYAEYLISECFSRYGFRRVSPLKAQTFSDEFGQFVPDYFLRKCVTDDDKPRRPYLGEMFSDHDFMEDFWEDLFEPRFVSRFKFDAWDDPDNDGWSNWAECRADTDPTKQNASGIDNYTVTKHPVPDIVATIVYNGDTSLDAPIYVQAYQSSDMSGMPDAIWQIGSSDTQEKYLGMNPNSVVNFTLGSGSVQPGSVKVKLKSTYWIDGSKHLTYYLDSAKWVPYIYETIDTSVPGATTGVLFIYQLTEENKVGTIDYATGNVTIDFRKCQDAVYIGESDSNLNTYFPAVSYFVVEWNGVVPNASTALTMHLRDPLPGYATPSSELIWKDDKGKHPSKGMVREGLNTFVAFLDLNGDAAWTPGEPYGVTPDVDVGWSGTSLKIELTRSTSEMMRINLRDAVAADGFEAQNVFTDRGVINSGGGSVPGNVALPGGTNMPLQTMTDVRVRIALDTINGRRSYNYVYTDDVVFDQCLNLAANPLLTEKNMLATGSLDLEWGTLGTQASNIGLTLANVTQAVYRVVIGNGTVLSSKTNNTLAVGFANAFDLTQPKCTLLSPQGAVYSQPTFKWKCNSAIGKAYPAFQLRVYGGQASAQSGGTLIYDSGARRAPARNSDGSYSWTAPIYPDMMTPAGKIFATTNNYFWTVSMLDAKFTTPLASQARQEFRLEASGQLGKISDYGLMRVKVRYFGPGTVATGALKGLIRVQAFTSPDFTGMPAGEARVTDVSQISSYGDIDVNAVILGLSPGTYYVRAFIDSDGDAKWSKWESWGYGNFVGAWDAALVSVSRGQLGGAAAGSAYVFTPRPYAVTVGEEPPTVDVFIEDSDTDADHLPDIYEYDTQGSLTKRSTPTGNTFFTKVNTNLATTVKSYTELNASSVGQTYAPIMLMNSIISGSDLMALAAGIDFFTDSSEGTENVAVRIDSFSLTDGLALSITSDVPVTDASDQSIFVTTDSANVKVVLMASNSPDFAHATETEVKTITIHANVETKEIVSADEIRAAIDAAAMGDAAFFKVKLEQ